MTDETTRRIIAIRATASPDGSVNYAAAARELGVPRETIRDWARRNLNEDGTPREGVDYADIPDSDLTAEQILDHMSARFEQRQAHHAAVKWMPVKLRTDDPVAVVWFGDPHLGANGCNVPLLRRDVNLVASTPGAYGANLGDTADNWTGRLIRLYADNDVSRATERRLAQWFLQDSGIRWLVWLEGNHDLFEPAFTTFLRSINTTQVPMLEWRARFRIVFPNGVEVPVDAAHDHSGHSMWNELHGQTRAAVMDEHADLYIAGHKHTWALAHRELAAGRVVWLARARGYKYIDDHSVRGGYVQQNHGASIVQVIDPQDPNPVTRQVLFADVERGLEYLKFLRAKRS